jgi:hypothetical protein
MPYITQCHHSGRRHENLEWEWDMITRYCRRTGNSLDLRLPDDGSDELWTPR